MNIEKKENNRSQSIKEFFRQLLNLSSDTDVDATIQNVSSNTEFHGVNVWLLVFAILLASIGLNVNSTAVIIGAMLVSPLMGPIVGIGLSIGIDDNELLKKSLKNLLIMVVLSLLTSTLYFLFTPLSDAQSELLARTKPSIFDVFIAFSGGVAGIVASSRKHQMTTVASGVAIATALMPPLCTAGYGLGTGQWNYFFGAFYLFFINSFFIALATFVMVRYMKFPHRTYVDEKKRKRVRLSLSLFAAVVIVPSIIIAIGMVKEASFNSSAISFVADLEKNPLMEDVQIVNSSREFSTKKQSITLVLVGKELEKEDIAQIQNSMREYGLENTQLHVRQNSGSSYVDIGTQAELLQGLIERKDAQLEHADSVITSLRDELMAERRLRNGDVEQIAREMAVLWSDVKDVSFAMAEVVSVQDSHKDTVMQVRVNWQKPLNRCDTNNVSPWLKTRLNNRPISVDHHYSK
ncbi:MAG: TIGR00341 family protein [Bacteroidales bacterium]|nr:TIGR00341 family protein [Bacteroidales bacterium]